MTALTPREVHKLRQLARADQPAYEHRMMVSGAGPDISAQLKAHSNPELVRQLANLARAGQIR